MVLLGHGSSVLALMAVAMFDQKPVVATTALTVVAHPHDDPTPVELLASKGELELALAKRTLRIAAVLGRPESPIPQHDGSTAVFTLRNGALEVPIVERVVLDLHRQAPVSRVEGRAFRHRPGLEHPI